MRNWKFSPEEIIISNKKGILHTADHLLSDSLALLNLACRRVDETIIYLNRMEPLEDVLAKQANLIDPEVAGEEWNQRQMIGLALRDARKSLLKLREAKLGAVERIEAEIRRVVRTVVKKAKPPKPPKPVKEQVVVPPVVVKVVMPQGAATPPAPLILDPVLLERMRQELADRANTVDE